jgi:hypothetical protein
LTDGDVDVIELLAFVSAIVPVPLVEDVTYVRATLAGGELILTARDLVP